MPALGTLLALLVGSPLVIFVLHGVVHRVLDRAGRRPSGHRSALVAIALGFAWLLAMMWALALVPVASPVEALATLAYAAAVYAVIGVLYLDVVNIAETSLHMHLLLQVAWHGSLDIEGLLERYSASRMIASRLERLASIGQLRVEDGRVVLADRSTLRFNALLDVWRRILGLPTEPDDEGARA